MSGDLSSFTLELYLVGVVVVVVGMLMFTRPVLNADVLVGQQDITVEETLRAEAEVLFVESSEDLTMLPFSPKQYFNRLTVFQDVLLKTMAIMVLNNHGNEDFKGVSKEFKELAAKVSEKNKAMAASEDISGESLYAYQGMVKGCYDVYLKGKRVASKSDKKLQKMS